MRMFVFFDLPVETPEDQSNYRHFRKGLIKNGFMMMQESVYTRLILNGSIERSVIKALQDIRPPKGLAQILVTTEKEYANMVFLTGEANETVLNTTDRLTIL